MDFLTPPVLMALVFAGAILILFFGLDQVISSRNNTIESRLDRYTARQGLEAGGGARVRAVGRFYALVNEKRGSAIATELARADIRLNPGEYVAINLATITVGALLGFILMPAPVNFVFGLVGGVVGFYLPRFYVR